MKKTLSSSFDYLWEKSRGVNQKIYDFCLFFKSQSYFKSKPTNFNNWRLIH